jgi:plasmid stabilization system protein ParE
VAGRLTWSPAARLDLREILAYIADDDPAAGRAFVGRVFKVVERLPSFPESGRVVPEFHDPSIREVVHRPCRIIYRMGHGDGTIEIVRVWHAARGVPRLAPRADGAGDSI